MMSSGNSDWKRSTLDLSRVFYKMKQSAEDELREYIATLPKTGYVDGKLIKLDKDCVLQKLERRIELETVQ